MFSGPEMKYTLALLLLADVTKSQPSGKTCEPFALAEALCARKVKIDLLSRGSEFEESIQHSGRMSVKSAGRLRRYLIP